MAKKPENGTQSAIDEIRELDRKRAEIADRAKSEALEIANEGVRLLTELGFTYTLTEGHPVVEARKPNGKGRSTQRQMSDGPCPYCEFKTEPNHDGRKHRSQDPKRPFTQPELMELGLRKVD